MITLRKKLLKMVNILYNGGGDVSFCTNKYNRENRTVTAKDGVSPSCVRDIKGKFFLNHHGWTFEVINKIINGRYANFYLIANQIKIYNLAVGSAQKRINLNSSLQIPEFLTPNS